MPAPVPVADPDTHPDESSIDDFVRGTLHADRRTALEAHIDACSACADLVTAMVRAYGEPIGAGVSVVDVSEDGTPTLAGSAASGPIAIELAPGTAVGRYRVLEVVGSGGMGVVYAAFDPELDRKVALKLLHATDAPGSAASQRRARLQREAQALARLSHPHVIGIYDVGTFQGDVFIAMEFVSGPTLGKWVKERERRWPELREIFVAAGRGLAAAHAAGLVHRDFKPDNVLIGKDGRVRVTDFGLARVEGTVVRESFAALRNADETHADARTLTQTGALIGTPAYMAPEQYEGGAADALSDQYSFCVALYEAIYGARPFEGRTLGELAANVLEGTAAPPRASHVPLGVRRAVMRGLSRERTARFPDMNALLAMLERDPARTWRRRAAIAAPAALAVAAVVAMARSDDSRPQLCRGEPLAGVWDDERRADIERAFGASTLPYANDSSTRVREGIDEYATRWTAVRDETCAAPRAEDDGSTVLSLVCLADRRDGLVAIVDLLARADDEVVRAAPRIPESLRAPEPCRDPRARAEPPPPPDPALVGRVQELRDELASARALSAAGKFEQALVEVTDLRGRADELGYGPLRAEVMNVHASMLDRLGRIDEARPAMYEALWMATQARHREVVARTWVELVYVLGRVESDFPEAHLAAEQARAEIVAIGGDPDLESARLSNLGTVQYTEGRYDDALATFDRALALRDAESQPLKRADVLYNIAVVELATGRHEQAAAHTRECLATWVEHAGPEHPETADLHHGLGMSFYQMGHYDDALVELEHARRLRASALGENNPDYVTSLAGIGNVLLELDRLDEAIAMFERGLAIEVGLRGPDHVELHNEQLNLAHAYAAAGRIDDAEYAARRGLELIEKGYGPDHPNAADALAAVAAIQGVRGDLEGAIASYGRAIAITKAVSDELPGLGPLHASLGAVLLRARRPADAVAQLELALARYRGDPRVDPWIVETRLDLARARAAGTRPR